MDSRRNLAVLACAAFCWLSLPTRGAAQDVDLAVLQKKILANLEKVRACTVGVGNGGSGVLVSKDGYILTCAHVAQKAGRRVSIRFPDGRTARATTLGNHHDADAGLIKLDKPGDYAFAKMGSSEKLAVGDWVLAVGYPVSFSKRQLPPVRLGRITRKFRTQLRSDAPIMGGDSGGPLFNLDGEVIGISSKVSGSVNNNIHVAVDEFTKNWERLVASEEWGRRYMASSGPKPPPPEQKKPAPAPKTPGKPDGAAKPGGGSGSSPAVAMGQIKQLGITKLQDTPAGPQIQGVIVDSLAWKSSLRAGHLIHKVRGKDVRSAADVASALAKAGSADKIEVVVGRQDRDHGHITLDLRLKE